MVMGAPPPMKAVPSRVRLPGTEDIRAPLDGLAILTDIGVPPGRFPSVAEAVKSKMAANARAIKVLKKILLLISCSCTAKVDHHGCCLKNCSIKQASHGSAMEVK